MTDLLAYIRSLEEGWTFHIEAATSATTRDTVAEALAQEARSWGA